MTATVTPELIAQTYARLGNKAAVARELKITRGTVIRHTAPADPVRDIPTPKHEMPKPPAFDFPEPFAESYTPHVIDKAGSYLLISDIHCPYHDRVTIELAVAEAKRRNVTGVIIDGDLVDSHEISRHDKDPSAPRYVEEIEITKKLLGWLRNQLPKADITFKFGNHDERLANYIVQRAPALFGLEGLDLPSLLHLKDFGVGTVSDRRVIAFGKLNIIHGHEFPGGCSSPVNPARGLYMKARSCSIAGHHHQSSEHHARNIRGTWEAAWSLGCACFLAPKYMPLNNWTHGMAYVELFNDGNFTVENKRVIGNKIV